LLSPLLSSACGALHAAAKSSTWHNDPRLSRTDEILILAEHWRRYVPTTGFWQIGDIKFDLGHVNNSYASVSVWYHGIKFDPAGVETILPGHPPETDFGSSPRQVTEASSEPTIEPEEKGPPVSEELLKQWYAVYGRAYHGSDDTLANAVDSARGMFPGKFVSRDRVRKLAGGRVRGRKPANSEND
jgi:hypothetical protein